MGKELKKIKKLVFTLFYSLRLSQVIQRSMQLLVPECRVWKSGKTKEYYYV